MPTATARRVSEKTGWELEPIARFPGLRVLSWQGSALYASRGYALLRAHLVGAPGSPIVWEQVGQFSPRWWRRLTSKSRYSSRLFRDGLHALAVLASGNLVAAAPGAIITNQKRSKEFSVSHVIRRGTRPLHIAAAPDGRAFWGEYFDNLRRDEVHIFGSRDGGVSWEIVYTFARGEVRHVHNVVYDPWEDCLWVLTGDEGDECRILRASTDFKRVETVISGNQQARAVAMVPTEDALYYSSDTPLESNHIYRLDRGGRSDIVGNLTSSSIYGCRAGDKIFFSTMVEPSRVNRDRMVRVYGGEGQSEWRALLSWEKDALSMRFFQYGNVILPGGNNTSGLLALTTIAVEEQDLETTIFKIQE